MAYPSQWALAQTSTSPWAPSNPNWRSIGLPTNIPLDDVSYRNIKNYQQNMSTYDVLLARFTYQPAVQAQVTAFINSLDQLLANPAIGTEDVLGMTAEVMGHKAQGKPYSVDEMLALRGTVPRVSESFEYFVARAIAVNHNMAPVCSYSALERPLVHLEYTLKTIYNVFQATHSVDDEVNHRQLLANMRGFQDLFKPANDIGVDIICLYFNGTNLECHLYQVKDVANMQKKDVDLACAKLVSYRDTILAMLSAGYYDVYNTWHYTNLALLYRAVVPNFAPPITIIARLINLNNIAAVETRKRENPGVQILHLQAAEQYIFGNSPQEFATYKQTRVSK